MLVSQDASEVHEHRQYRRRIRKCHTVHVSCVELCPQLSVHTDLQEARPGSLDRALSMWCDIRVRM